MSNPQDSNELKQLNEEMNTFLVERNIKLVPTLSFPNYNKLPIELELAVAIMQKHEPQFDVSIVLDEKKPTVS